MKKYFLKLLICTFFSLLMIELVFKIKHFELFNFELVRIILFTLEISLIISFIFSLCKPLVAKIGISIITLFFGLYTLLQLSFKSFMGNFMSISMLTGGGEASRINGEIGTFISEIEWSSYLCLIPFIILIFVFIFIKIDYEIPSIKASLISFCLIIFVNILIYFSLTVTPLNQIKTNRELYKIPNLIDISLKEFGPTRFLYRDIIAYIKNDSSSLIDVTKPANPSVVIKPDYNRIIDDSKWETLMNSEKNEVIKNLHEYYMNQNITPKNDYTGMFKDKNMILIMVEALDMIAIDPVLTPTLYKMQQEGIYFDNYYAPKFSCTTGESEFVALTSIIPSNTVCTPFTYLNNDYSTSIFNLFNESNYKTTSYHSWNDQYYPRKTLHKNMGSTYFYNDDDLKTKVGLGWPSDIDLMKKAYDIFSKEEKYFSFIITASMHFSYDIDTKTVLKNWDMVKDLSHPKPIKRYLAKAIEFDKAMEYLLEQLKKDDQLDNTVIALFGDHHPYNLNFDDINKLSNVDRKADLNEDLMPFIIYNSSTKANTINKTASTFDILPTIANLFDLKYDPRYYMGNDIFSAEEGIALFPSGSWVSDKAVYFANTNKFKLKDNTLTGSYIDDVNKVLNNKFSASDNTLKKDYFKFRFSR